jgi:hypothetical protein
MAKQNQTLRIDYAKDDINYFNGFRNASKLLNTSLQYLTNALDDVPIDHLKDTVAAWRDAAGKDFDSIVQGMYNDLKGTYGMALRVDSDGCYYIKLADGDNN